MGGMDPASPTRIPLLPLLGLSILASASIPFSRFLGEPPSVAFTESVFLEGAVLGFLGSMVLAACLRRTTPRSATALVVFCILALLVNLVLQQLLAYASFRNMY